jgi:hypothetical protein
VKPSHGLIAVGLALGSCRSREAFLYSCAPADATRHQRTNQVMTLYLLDHLDVALANYSKRCGGYPRSLEALLPPAPGGSEDCDRSGAYLDAGNRDGDNPEMTQWHHEAFVRVTKDAQDHGYRITYRAPGSSGAVASGYEIAADPVEREKTGFESYWMSPQGGIHESSDGRASEADPVLRFPQSRPATR